MLTIVFDQTNELRKNWTTEIRTNKKQDLRIRLISDSNSTDTYGIPTNYCSDNTDDLFQLRVQVTKKQKEGAGQWLEHDN